METWGDVWRRSQNLADAYARRFPEKKVLFVEKSHDVTFALRTRNFAVLKSVLRGTPQITAVSRANFYITAPIKLFPNSMFGGKFLNNAIARLQVRHAQKLLKMKAPVYLIKPYWGCHYAGKMGELCVLYDIGDDWNAIKQSKRATRWTREEDEFLTKRADAVTVVSEYLRQQKSQFRDDVFLIPNGIDTERYADVWRRTLPSHSLTENWRRPVLGYTGMLHAERLDIDLILETAQAFPEATIALVGPNLLDTQRCDQLRACANLVISEPVPYRDVPALMSAFDVCLVPNLVNDFSESQNPLKMFEYLASGLPIVSTNVAGFRDYSDLVRIANSPQEFIEEIQEALVEGTAQATLRQAAVQSETWDARLDALLKAIEYAKSKRNK